MKHYDNYLQLLLKTGMAKEDRTKENKELDIPDLYIFDQRYMSLFLMIEIEIRSKGYFVSKDLKDRTSLSDKSVERFIKYLVKKGHFLVKTGEDKRVKIFYPSKVLDKHIMTTWRMRIRQIEAILDFKTENLEKMLTFLRKTDEYPLPGDKKLLIDRPEAENLLGIYSSLCNQGLESSLNEFEGKNFSDLKKKLSEKLISEISPISKDIKKLLADTEYLDQILIDGAVKAEEIASNKVKEIQKILGF